MLYRLPESERVCSGICKEFEELELQLQQSDLPLKSYLQQLGAYTIKCLYDCPL